MFVAAPSLTLADRVRAAAAIGLLSVALATPSWAQSCAVSYRKALDDVRDKRSESISAVVRTVRSAEGDLTGNWLFSATLLDPKRKPRTESYCAETTTSRSGKTRCVRYEKRTVMPSGEPAIRSSPTADETKDLKALAQFVDLKGAVPELGANGRFGFLFQRIGQDLRAYLGQEAHPGLCAGGSDLTEFYEGQVAPLKRRQMEAGDLAKRTRSFAETRLMAMHKAETAGYEKAVATAKAAAEKMSAALTPPANAAVPPPLAPDPPQAAPASYAGKPLVELTAAAIRPVATPEQLKAVADQTSPIKALALARSAFLTRQSNDGSVAPVDPALLEASGQALRMIEAATYAELQRTRYRDVEMSVFAAIVDIRQAHKTACTCAD